ncbi:LysR substrate-binding domain-containing protein [Sedimentitalea nanhaiensis]|uniref:Aminoethylphosphonate catabolism associated LysR family transcriptional regulator n=1 Tax=Sedimentitalea nanhaiensis TaxID=999627 RepID=A0A1I7D2Y0_9RHOB|nr:LysR substrate-binding domain-containing protein [Sedimentitalea nanhaiensis]SFU05966.1 aminoethylphosphonate catabolism associated LysR family transcriptional regulator [Sedimentitalea nanhaiensis]
MRHSQLKAFHHVALLGGFSRAAESLYLTQPAISEQVRKLEQDHDVLLFHRERKRVRLTRSGERLFRLTRQYFEVEQQIGELMSEAGAAIDGELRIVADSAHHVTAILGRFRKRYPEVTVSLHGGNTEDILEQLRAYEAEIGVVGDVSPGKEMVSLGLGGSDIVAFAAHGILQPPRQALGLKELIDLPLIFREAGSKTRQKLEAAAAVQGIVLHPAIVAEGREAVRELVASGAGVGFVSRAEYGNDDRLELFDLQADGLHMHETIVHLAQRRDVKVIRAFMDIAWQELAAHPRSV